MAVKAIAGAVATAIVDQASAALKIGPCGSSREVAR